MRFYKRRELKGQQTTWFSAKIQTELYERLRTKAFNERKSVSLLITEFLQQGLDKEGEAAQ